MEQISLPIWALHKFRVKLLVCLGQHAPAQMVVLGAVVALGGLVQLLVAFSYPEIISV